MVVGGAAVEAGGNGGGGGGGGSSPIFTNKAASRFTRVTLISLLRLASTLTPSDMMSPMLLSLTEMGPQVTPLMAIRAARKIVFILLGVDRCCESCEWNLSWFAPSRTSEQLEAGLRYL